MILLAIVGLAVPMILVSSFSGCSTRNLIIGLNPYELLTKIDAVDHTNFFVATYNSFIGAGLDAVAQEATTQAQNNGLSTTKR
jgi:hypothetical protein